jgi:hypothetical protein
VDVITIMDYSKPRRTPGMQTGHAEADWYQQSTVCNCTAGELPANNIDGVWKEAQQLLDGTYIAPGWTRMPKTGYRVILETLLREGCLVPSRQLDEMLRRETRELVPNELRIHYISE